MLRLVVRFWLFVILDYYGLLLCLFWGGLGGITIACWLRAGLGESVTLGWLFVCRLVYFSCCLFVCLFALYLDA